MAAWEKDRIDHYEGERLRELFVGRRVIAAEDGVLTLDDGTRAKVEPNEGCGGCPSGRCCSERWGCSAITRYTSRRCGSHLRPKPA